MIVSWLPLINLAVIIASFRWSKYSFFAHLLLALAVIGLSLAGCIHLLRDYWLDTPPDDFILKIHKVAGFVMLIWLGVEFVTGWMARLIQFPQNVSPNISYWMKRTHIILSYLVMLIAKMNYYIIMFGPKGQFNTLFFLLMAGDILFLTIYLWIKFGYWTLSEQTIDSQLKIPLYKKNSNIILKFIFTIVSIFKNISAEMTQKAMKLPERRQIQAHYKSQSEITLENYVIFNDYVYDTKNFKWFHPGGEQVIKLVDKREVDRFLYGCYTLEIFPNMKIWSHTQDSLRLVGPPFAKIIRNPPMKGLIEFSKCQVLSCAKINPVGKTYIVNLSPINSLTLSFEGFQSQKQFGQYFSLTIRDMKKRKRCTRLYTTIWCMRKENIIFHEKYFSQFRTLTNFNKPRFSEFEMNKTHETDQQQMKNKIKESIPLIIKRYEKGQLTSRFLNDVKFEGEVVISEPMGTGLKFEQISEEGSVIIVCGGTGLLPFCDLVDILFKRVKYLESPQIAEILQRCDPLIKKDIIKQREFVMYCAVENPQQLPVLTLYQLNELSGSSKINFNMIMRMSQEEQMIKRDFKNIALQKGYFDQQVEAHLRLGNLAQIYICGPPSMNASMGNLMIKNKVDQRLYHFV